MPEVIIKVKALRCRQCGHTWQTRKKGKPGKCPSCQSTYWDKAR